MRSGNVSKPQHFYRICVVGCILCVKTCQLHTYSRIIEATICMKYVINNDFFFVLTSVVNHNVFLWLILLHWQSKYINLRVFQLIHTYQCKKMEMRCSPTARTCCDRCASHCGAFFKRAAKSHVSRQITGCCFYGCAITQRWKHIVWTDPYTDDKVMWN